MDSFFADQLLGYEDLHDVLRAKVKSKTLHHAILFSGLEGSGKKKLCFEISKDILAAHDNQMSLEIAKHPDIKIIAADPEQSKKGEITVKQIRALNSFLQLKSGFSDCKIIIIDSIDDLNQSAANSLLKTLEEPPENSFFLCLSHNPSKLLDTIKSRVLNIKLKNLTKDLTREIVNNLDLGISKEVQDLALELYPHQPGKIISVMQSDVVKYRDDIKTLLRSASLVGSEKFLQKVNLKDNQIFKMLNELISHEAYLVIKEQNSHNAEMSDLCLALPQSFNECLNLNLDRTNYLRNFFYNWNNVSR